MRVLLVHNAYGSSAPSGENQVVDVEREMLVSGGNEVEVLMRHSDEIRSRGALGVAIGGLATAWNPWAAHTLHKMIEKFRPEVVHAHNTFPLLSPAVFHAVGNRAARILTLHNYRLFCSAAIPLRRGLVCTECLDRRSSVSAIRYGCYRGSRLATLPLAFSIALHRKLGTWTRHVDAFIALSDFQRGVMVEAGLPSAKVHVKPNCYPGSPVVVPFSERGHYAVFVGRLGSEKGARSLLKAWRAWGVTAPELRFVGDGELRSELERMAIGLPVRFLGQLPASLAQGQIAHARLLLLPSECYEGFPMVLREAFAFGTPAAVSNIGPLPSIVQDGVNGIVFAAAQPMSLMTKVRTAWDEQGLLERLGCGARGAFEAKYTEEVNYHRLMTIYEKAIAVSKAGG